MSSSHVLLKYMRLVHLYLGVFITPMLLFFAITGFVQTFNLHETLKGRTYTPPDILVRLGQFHKKQTLVVPANRLSGNSDKQRDAHGAGPDAQRGPGSPTAPVAPVKKQNLWPMKLFFGLVSIGLLISTLTGIYMSYKYVRNRVLVTGLLVAGAVTPVVLLAF
jgi:hypothetical protein